LIVAHHLEHSYKYRPLDAYLIDRDRILLIEQEMQPLPWWN
jgi:hypothetical protein